MHEFQIGDLVRVRSKEELDGPDKEHFMVGMEVYVGCESSINKQCPFAEHYFDLDISQEFWWHESLLELIPDEDTADLLPADDHEIGVLLGLRGG